MRVIRTSDLIPFDRLVSSVTVSELDLIAYYAWQMIVKQLLYVAISFTRNRYACLPDQSHLPIWTRAMSEF